MQCLGIIGASEIDKNEYKMYLGDRINKAW